MADHQKMYGVLCRAADAGIDPMEKILQRVPYAKLLKCTLLKAEEIYVQASLPEEENTAE